MTLPPETIIPEMKAEEKKKRARKPSTGFSESGASSEPKGPRSVDRQVDEIRAGLSGIFGGMSKLVGNFDQFDAFCISTNSPGFVDAVCRAAKTDSRMRGWLLSMVHVSAYSDIALYASMMLVPILLHHFPNLLSFGGANDDNNVDVG
jgi:hypothetical protein